MASSFFHLFQYEAFCIFGDLQLLTLLCPHVYFRFLSISFNSEYNAACLTYKRNDDDYFQWPKGLVLTCILFFMYLGNLLFSVIGCSNSNHYFLCRETGMSRSSIAVFRECSFQYVIIEEGICMAYRRGSFSTRAGRMETFVSQCSEWLKFQHILGQHFVSSFLCSCNHLIAMRMSLFFYILIYSHVDVFVSLNALSIL